jgi:hypothetical protein
LTKLGQDVAGIKDRLDALEARVAAVEEEQRRVKFNGALNLIAEGFSSTDQPFFQDANGQFPKVTKHIFQNDAVLNDFLLTITGRISDTATANVKLDFGNYLATRHNTAGITGSDSGGPPGDSQTTVWEANVDQPVNLGPLGGADLVAGRFGQQWTKYTLMQTDDDVYTSLYQTDSGNIITDGARVDLKVGPAAVNAWAGKFDQIPFAQPSGGPAASLSPFQSLPGGLLTTREASPFVQGAGVRAVLGNFVRGTLGASFAEYGMTTGTTSNPDNGGAVYGVLSVYGLDFNGAFPLIGSRNGLTLDANITDSPVGTNSRSVNDEGNSWRYMETDDQAGYTLGALSLKGGYQYVGPEYTAPGSWGKIGAWTDPSNIEGPVGSAKYVMSSKLALTGDIEGYQAAYGSLRTGGNENSPLQQGDKLNHWKVGAAYGLTSSYDVDLGYEMVNWELKNQNATLPGKAPGDYKPTESFLTIGLGHTFNPNASFKLLYQIIEYKDKNSNFDSLGGPGFDFNGNVAVGQFQLKF